VRIRKVGAKLNRAAKALLFFPRAIRMFLAALNLSSRLNTPSTLCESKRHGNEGHDLKA
jgi:hypothetical protein